MPLRKSSGSGKLSDIDLPNGWKVGRKLGEGAQGSVHVVVDGKTQKETQWAVKLTVKPTNPRSKTQMEAKVNEISLRNEGQLYVAHLQPLRGTIVPDIPLPARKVRESAGTSLNQT